MQQTKPSDKNSNSKTQGRQQANTLRPRTRENRKAKQLKTHKNTNQPRLQDNVRQKSGYRQTVQNEWLARDTTLTELDNTMSSATQTKRLAQKQPTLELNGSEAERPGARTRPGAARVPRRRTQRAPARLHALRAYRHVGIQAFA